MAANAVKIPFTEAAAPSTPAASKVVIYAKTDGLMYSKDDAGTETLMSGGTAGGTGYDEGTSFPGAPTTGDKFFHNTYDMLFYYDGTRWLCTCPHFQDIGFVAATLPLSATGTSWRASVTRAAVDDLWLVSFSSGFTVAGGGSALSASHKWVLDFYELPAGNILATYSIDSGTSSTWRHSGHVAIGALLGTTEFAYQVAATKTGTPGDLYAMPQIEYRIVGV